MAEKTCGTCQFHGEGGEECHVCSSDHSEWTPVNESGKQLEHCRLCGAKLKEMMDGQIMCTGDDSQCPHSGWWMDRERAAEFPDVVALKAACRQAIDAIDSIDQYFDENLKKASSALKSAIGEHNARYEK